MTLIVDQREKNKEMKALCDEEWLLDYEREGQILNDDGTPYSYDFLIAADGIELRFERKTLVDFVGSWKSGRLERQLEAVHGLLLENDPFDLSDKANSVDAETEINAMKHLAVISSRMWVILSPGWRATIEILRYIERNPKLELRQNRVKGRGESIRQRLLGALPGVNPDRIGAEAELAVDWEALAKALNLPSWKEKKLLGEAAIRKIETALASKPLPAEVPRELSRS